jgi:CRISPR-associated protein Cmr2
MYDFFAAIPAYTATQLEELKSNPPVDHAPSLIALLAQSTALEETKLKGQAWHRELVEGASFRRHVAASWGLLEDLALLAPEVVDLRALPPLSFYLRIDFRLASPYLSRDDRAFSVTENPVRKDPVFGLPMVASTTWKGALRSVCRLIRPALTERLFGPEQAKEGEEGAFRGRLFFFPSFFRGIRFEIINPHDRAHRIGKNPIYMECVPEGSESRFGLLYVAVVEKDKAAEDVEAVAESCETMFLHVGFAAKKTSGYGTASPRLGRSRGVIMAACAPNGRVEVNSLDTLHDAAKHVADCMRALP